MFTIITISFLLIFIDGKFLFTSDHPSLFVLRHVHLSTDEQFHSIECPEDFHHLNLQLLNYSNEFCFNLYSPSNICRKNYSPCQFQAKSIQLSCHNHSYSKYVDISYQCAYEDIMHTFTSTSTSAPVLSANQDETLSLFLIGFGIILTVWLFFCCIWFICCQIDDDDEDEDENDNHSQFIRHRSSWRTNRNKKSSRSINPLENKSISSFEI